MMILNGRHMERYRPGRKYSIKGNYNGKPLLLTLEAKTSMDAITQAKEQYPSLEVISVHVEKAG